MHLLSLFDITSLIRYGGLPAMFLIVYLANGLFFLLFVPTGAVLFTGGVLIATGALPHSFFAVCALLALASLAGTSTAYWMGKKAGPSLYQRQNSRFFRRQYLEAAETFYAKHGKLTLLLAFYLPIVRNFAPMVAGIVRMRFYRFLAPTAAGSVLWVASFMLAGYFIGSRPLLKPWLPYIVAAVIVFVTLPIVLRIVRELRAGGKTKGGDKPAT